MTDDTPKLRWRARQLSEEIPHLSAVFVAFSGIIAGDIGIGMFGASDFAFLCVDFALLFMCAIWAVFLDEHKVAGSVALSALWICGLASGVFSLAVLIYLYFDTSLDVGGHEETPTGALLAMMTTVVPKLILLGLCGLHTTIVIGRGIRDRFAREQAEIDAAEGVHDVGRRGFDHDNEEGDDDD